MTHGLVFVTPNPSRQSLPESGASYPQEPTAFR